MTGQLSRVDVAVLPVGWTTVPASLPSEVSGSWSPTLSPDGRHAAYVSDRGGRPQVWVQPVGSDLAFLVDTGPEPVTSVHWSTGGGWLACQLAPGAGPRHEVWLVRPDGSQLHQVAGFGTDTAENLRWLPGRSLLALSENLTTTLLIDPAGGRTVVAHGPLLSLLDVNPAGTRALLRHGPRGARRIVVRDLTSGAETEVTAGEQAVFGPDGTTVYAKSEAGEFPTLIRVTDAQVEVLATAATAEVESFAVTADGRTAAVLWNVRGGTSRLTLLDLDHNRQRVQPPPGSVVAGGGHRVVEPLPGPVVTGPAFSPDGSALTFTAEGPGQPHGVWVVAVAAGEGAALTAGGGVAVDGGSTHGRVQPVSAEPPAAGTAFPTLETFTAHDGLALTGWLFRPIGAGPHPTMIWLHGGPEAQERPGHGPLFQSLVDRGIAVFAANVRGSSGFGRSFVNADNGPLRYAAIEDIRSCATYLIESGIASRLGCMGRSYGGYLTLAALTSFPDLFTVGVDVCGMSNFATFYEYTEPWIAAAAVSKYGDPVTDADLLADLSPLNRIDRLRAPLLLVHGSNDTNVPVIESDQVASALADRGIPHRYLLFAGEGHELLRRESRALYLRETVEWITTHL